MSEESFHNWGIAAGQNELLVCGTVFTIPLAMTASTGASLRGGERNLSVSSADATADAAIP
jgi:hypothetical protein